MIRATIAAVVLSVAGIGATTAFAQVRDTPRRAVGTASISGVVVTDADTPAPVRRVLVQLTDVTTGRPPIAAITDDAGKFAFADLPAGAYTLVAARAAYVTSAYGAKAYGRGSGVPISLANGQQVRDVTIRMIHGAAIAGTLREPSGRPAANVELMLMRVKSGATGQRLAPIQQPARTDSRGQFRAFGLAPGDYVIRAQPSGNHGDLREASSTGRSVEYAASYYPGTTDASAASLITVAAGEERLGIDFAMALVPTATITGRLIGPDGQPPRNGSLSLQVLGSPTAAMDTLIGIGQTGNVGGRSVAPDGTFSLPAVAPGRYRLVARGAQASTEVNKYPQTGAVTALTPSLAGALGSTLWAAEEIAVDGRDISNLALRLQDGLTMQGSVVFEDPDPKAPPDVTRASISLFATERTATSAIDMIASMITGMNMGRTLKGGAFSVPGLIPGRYRLTASPNGRTNPFAATATVPGDWALKSAIWHDRDISDGTFEIQPGDDLSGVVVTFTKQSTEISGRLLTTGGQPASGFPIVVFSTRAADWVAGSRRVTSAKPRSDGTYRVAGLPPGEYYVCALVDLDPSDLLDPAFLEQLAPASFRLTLSDGEKKVQDLKIGGGG